MAVIDCNIQEESQNRYLTYAMSVISSRALPDVRDGLKPVQRRILFDMYQHLNLLPNGSHRKSAAVVGGVLARFHPHGDVACYEAMVRMAQDFSLRYPLVDGQGNFGSLDGDSAAAYRYTEVKLRELALDIIGEINEETVDYRDNFDATQREPVVLPSRLPNVLLNGAVGIAVGMATNIPPHNLRETIKALVAQLEDPEISVAKLTTHLRGPDFPTGCSILNSKKEIEEIYATGRGSIRTRGDWEIEEQSRGKKSIIITTIPYAVTKSTLVEKIADLIGDRKVPQLVDIRDESTTEVRIVIELAPEANAEVAMAYLFKHTALESNFAVNLTALAPSGESGALRPELLNLKQILQHFLNFRLSVTEKRLRYERKKLSERIHILEGLVLIYDVLDQVIKLIRNSDGRQDAAEALQKKFKLSEIQSYAIVDMRLYQLSKTSIAEIRAELKEKSTRVAEIDKILKSPKAIATIVRKELEELAEKYGDARRSKLMKDVVEVEFSEEMYVVHEDVHAIITRDGWMKRIRQNNELGTTRVREGDAILHAHALSTKDSVAILTNFGSLYVLKVTNFPASSGYGEPVQKLLKFKDGEKIIDSFELRAESEAKGSKEEKKEAGPKQGELFSAGKSVAPEKKENSTLVQGTQLIFITKQGMGCLTALEELDSTKRSGKRVVKVKEGDEVIAVVPVRKQIALFSHDGYGVVFQTKEIPERNPGAQGVIVLGLRDGDSCVGAVSFDRDRTVTLKLGSGGDKEIETKEIVRGKRALKGNRVIARGEITAVFEEALAQ
jgi:DNA gyrase subunit A